MTDRNNKEKESQFQSGKEGFHKQGEAEKM